MWVADDNQHVNGQIKNEVGLGGKKKCLEVWNINSLCITGLGVATRRPLNGGGDLCEYVT